MSLPVIKDLDVSGYLRELAADSLFPSAGAAAGLTAAQGAALFAMVCRVNLRKQPAPLWERALEQAATKGPWDRLWGCSEATMLRLGKGQQRLLGVWVSWR